MLILTGTKVLNDFFTPCSHVGKLLFLVNIITIFPLYIVLLVVTEKEY